MTTASVRLGNLPFGPWNVRPPNGPDEFERYYDLRWRVLRAPWSQDRGSERDEYEVEAVHVGAWLGDKLIGVGRVHFVDATQAHIRFMAVEPESRRAGVGSAILHQLEYIARARRCSRVVLNARDYSVGFYFRHGYFVARESQSLFDSIPHWEMYKILE
jgi:GNAT superfamily N-acetyltransferase